MLPAVVTPIDPSTGLDEALNAITTAISTNQGSIMLVGGGLLAVSVLWRFVRKFVKP